MTDQTPEQKQDKVVKVVELAAPVARVWRALTDHEEFGAWFRVKLEGPFVVGELSRGRITHPGLEHMVWVAQTERMDKEKLFAFSWCPLDENPDTDKWDALLKTLVEFRLEPTEAGTRLTITESGFAKLPEPQGLDSLRRNDEGWSAQVRNIVEHVES